MMTRYQIELTHGPDCKLDIGWAYRLYAALLDQLPSEQARQIHEAAVPPLGQFLKREADRWIWEIGLLGEQGEQFLGPILERTMSYALKDGAQEVRAKILQKEAIADLEELLSIGRANGTEHQFYFHTPTAFKSKGVYLSLPTTRLLLQSLVKKWNGNFPEYQIEDTDGEGLDALSHGLSINWFSLRSRRFWLKGREITGFAGKMVLENKNKGFHWELVNALLYFAQFSGIGVKTALGMGGVEYYGNGKEETSASR